MLLFKSFTILIIGFVLLIKGAIPGPKGGVVLVRTAVKGA